MPQYIKANFLLEEFVTIRRPSLITQIGCFGSLNSIEELVCAFRLVQKYRARISKFVSVTWIARTNYMESIRWGGTALRELSPEGYMDAAILAGHNVIDYSYDEIDDPYYSGRLMLETL